MKAAIVTFPGSNCDRDLRVAFAAAGFEAVPLWHKETSLPPGTDVVGLPGGFSHGDYLRCGAIAARAPVMGAVAAFARSGGHVLGICNGFQVLCEAGLLPGTLMRNAGLRFVCREVGLAVGTSASPFTAGWRQGARLSLPVAHHDGNFAADDDVLERLFAEERVAFTYTDNPNGSARDIAGVLSANRRVLGMMPHPERATDAALCSTAGAPLFAGLAAALAGQPA
ncbi:MAG: phosphoribosylformylglycinamidine synthase subunit PurQ [Rhodobacteraceae bacterium]|nr:phosphoribosylformylglycinamidine synthase subunit PurQ [Paracoccaceae bacterium]